MKGRKTYLLSVSLFLAWPAAGLEPQQPPFTIPWHTIDSGGGTAATAADFDHRGTVGQPDAGRMSGGTFELSGGFWALPLTDCPLPGALFCDGFEGGDTSAWSVTVGD